MGAATQRKQLHAGVSRLRFRLRDGAADYPSLGAATRASNTRSWSDGVMRLVAPLLLSAFAAVAGQTVNPNPMRGLATTPRLGAITSADDNLPHPRNGRGRPAGG